MKHDWRTMKFAEVFDLQMGKTPSRDNPSYWNGEYPWVSISDLKGKYISATKEKITTKALESGINKVRKGTVIMSFKLTVGRAAIADCDLYTNEAIMSFVPKPGFDILTDYIYYYLRGHKWMGANKAVMGQTLNKKSISENVFAFPPLPVQEQICSLLDKMNRVIEAKKEQLKELDNLAQSIFYDMFGDPGTNNKGWVVKKLGDVCTIERGGSPRPISDFITEDPNGINWIKIGDAVEGSKYINATKEKIRVEGMKKSRFVHKGDFILSNSMSFGKPYILGVDGCIHDGWLVIHDDNNTFNKDYLYYYLSSPMMYQEFSKLAVGGVVNNLNSQLVRNVSVAIPPLQIQQIFSEKMAVVERQKELINQSIREAQTLFDSRMEYYFGE